MVPALHPPVDRDVVDVDASLGKQLLDVATWQQPRSHRNEARLSRSPGTG
jgi:hypothetical protein